MPFVKSNDENQIVEAVEKSTLIGRLEDWNEILKVVSKWRMYIGIPKKEIDAELSIATEFIGKTYPHLTLAEIELAYTLSIARKLEDVEFFGYFSPLYIGKVIDSYLFYRKTTMADTIRRRERHLQELAEQKNIPTPEQQAKDTKEIIKHFYDKCKESGEVDDPLNITYNFLRKHQLIKISQQDIDNAMAYGKEKTKQKKMNIFQKVLKDSDEFEIKIHARNYVVKKYFENVDIDVLINNIKPEHFK
jgi:hypothetical protein